LEELKKKDPDFFKFLEANDKNLLTFGEGDEEDDEGDEDEEGEDDEEGGEGEEDGEGTECVRCLANG
jgi:nucleolar complex protein 2